VPPPPATAAGAAGAAVGEVSSPSSAAAAAAAAAASEVLCTFDRTHSSNFTQLCTPAWGGGSANGCLLNKTVPLFANDEGGLDVLL
jgi:hypothetical protein